MPMMKETAFYDDMENVFVSNTPFKIILIFISAKWN